jgi:hypothetical protein
MYDLAVATELAGTLVEFKNLQSGASSNAC